MSPAIQIKALGQLAIHDPSGRELRLPTRKSRALLAYLALHPGKHFARAHLAGLLWVDQPDVQARQSLRQALSTLRAVAGPDVIGADADLVHCRSEAVASDVQQFETLCGRGTLDAAEKANALYGGELLENHDCGQSGFDDWLSGERERLREIARHNLGRILLRRSSDPDLARAIATANSLTRLDPFDESVHRTLMRLYARQGRVPRAIRHFHRFSVFLRDELGISPDDATIALYGELCAERTTAPALHTLYDYAFVLEQQAFCVVVTDPASHIVGWNKAAEAEFGYSKDFMFGRTPTLIYAPRRDQSLADNLFRLACERGHWSSRVKLLAKDGRESYQTRTIAPLYDRTGALIGGFGTGIPAA